MLKILYIITQSELGRRVEPPVRLSLKPLGFSISAKGALRSPFAPSARRQINTA